MLPPLPSETEILAWADRLYASVAQEVSLSSMEDTERVLEAYRRVVRRHPRSERGRRGFARALFRLGRYEAAASAYRRLSMPGREGALATRYAGLVARIVDGLPAGRYVDHLYPLSMGRWAAITSNRRTNAYGLSLSYGVDLRVFADASGDLVLQGEPQELSIPDEAVLESSFFRTHRTPGWVTVRTRRIGGDWSPNDVHVFRIEPNQLRLIQEFHSSGETRVRARRGAPMVAVTPTWKVWWTDAYEWTGRGYRLANERNFDLPSRLDGKGERRDTLGDWLTWAALVTKRQDREESIRAWKEAERYAILAQRGEFDGEEERFGKSAVVLRQIRHRLAWLRRDDWNHALLYRPYDWDVQVPPFKLGAAQPVAR